MSSDVITMSSDKSPSVNYGFITVVPFEKHVHIL